MSAASFASIRFVYFDLGNVLARFDIARACQNVSERWNVDASAVREALWTSGMQDRFEHGHESDESFAQWTRQSLGLRVDDCPTDQLLDRLSDMFEPIREMESVVDAVRASGTPLGILSNTCGAHWRWLTAARYPSLQGHFDQLILSYELGVMKPHPSIYHTAQARASVPPETILFFDDRADNIAAAKECGWQAYVFTDAASALEMLRCHRVVP